MISFPSLPFPPGLRPFFAKLVIAVSGVVAVATSAPPRWNATEESELLVSLDERLRSAPRFAEGSAAA